jgi:hypothetical protein
MVTGGCALGTKGLHTLGSGLHFTSCSFPGSGKFPAHTPTKKGWDLLVQVQLSGARVVGPGYTGQQRPSGLWHD